MSLLQSLQFTFADEAKRTVKSACDALHLKEGAELGKLSGERSRNVSDVVARVCFTLRRRGSVAR